jgi:kynureninase
MTPTRHDAQAMDAADDLAHFRQRFLIADPDVCYLDGNSLGRLPLATIDAMNHVLTAQWGGELVDGWAHWIDEAQTVGDLVGAATLGAAPGQTLVQDTTSANLYQLCVAALAANRRTIVTDAANFPTDRYILGGIAERLGLRLVLLDNDRADEMVTADMLAPYLDDVAVVSLQIVQYRSGARQDVVGITEMVREHGAMVVWDAAHAGGSIDLRFDDWGVDLAVGCTYKYGNSGPGAPAWLYVRRDLQDQLRVPIQGWFANRDQFAMGQQFIPADGIRRFTVGTPPVLALRAVRTSYAMIAEAGMAAIADKAARGTQLMVDLFDAWLAPLGFTLLTPRDAHRRGGHITISHPDAKQIAAAMRTVTKTIPDYREPNSIRLAISPLPTSYTEVWDGFDRLRELVASERFRDVRSAGRVT